MKTLLALLTLISANAFGMSTYTTCSAIQLMHSYQSVELHLSKKGELNSNLDKYLTNQNDHRAVEIKGLKVELLKKTLIDRTEKRRYGLGGGSTTFSQVYGVKFKVTADEPIAQIINGCIPQEVNETEAYAICHQNLTIMDRE